MPFALLLVGAVLLTAGVRNRQNDLYGLVKGDFTGPNNFVFWVIAILAIGAVGYIKPLKPLSNIFLVLIVVVLILANKGGFFSQFTQQIQSATGAGSPAIQSLPLSTFPVPSITDFSSLGVKP